jgi:hypothetical protein
MTLLQSQKPLNTVTQFTKGIKQHGLVLLLLCILTIIVRYNGVSLISTHYIGGAERDAGLYIWLSKVSLKALNPNHWFSTNAFFPYTKTLAWSDSFILPAALIQALCVFGVAHSLAYNSIILVVGLLNGAMVYLFSFKLFNDRLAATVAGSACILLAYFSSNLGHPQLQFAFFIPLTALLVFRCIDKPSKQVGIGLGLCIGGAFLTTVYYAVFCGLIAFLLFGLHLVSGNSRNELKRLTPSFLGSLIGVAPLIPFILPYLDVEATFGGRHFYEAHAFGASPLSYVSQSPQSLLYSFTSSWSHSEAWLFPGFLVAGVFLYLSIQALSSYRRSLFLGSLIVFVLVSLLPVAVIQSPLICCICSLLLWMHPLVFFREYAIKNHDAKIAILGFAVFFVGLSFGSLTPSDGVWWDLSPFSIFFRFMPGMSGVRVSARLGLIALMLMCTSMSFLFNGLTNTSKRWCLAAVLILGVGLENWVCVYPIETIPATPDAVTQLKSIKPTNSAAIILPLTTSINTGGRVSSWSDFAFQNVNAMNWFAETDIKLVNGYSGIRSDIIENYPRKLSGFPDARSLTTLGLLPNLDYVVVLPQFTAHRTAQALLTALGNYSDQITPVYEGADGSVLLKFTPLTSHITKESFLLRVPSQQESALTISLRSPIEVHDNSESKEVVVDVLSVSLSGEETKITEVRIPTGKQWVERTVQLQSQNPGVAPHFLRFIPQNFADVEMGTRIWSNRSG